MWRWVIFSCLLIAANLPAREVDLYSPENGYVVWLEGRRIARESDFPKPEYPRQARLERRQLAAIIRLYIEPDGHVSRTRALVRAGDEELLEYARSFMQRCYQFPPPTINGRPARVFVNQRIIFVLHDREAQRFLREIMRSIPPLQKPPKEWLQRPKSEAGSAS